MNLSFEQLPEAVGQLFTKLENIERLLSEKGNPQPEADSLLTIQQAAEFINLSVPTLYGLVSHSEIPVNKKGKRLYFSKKELTDWIKTGRKKTVAEIDLAAQNHVNRKAK